MTARALPVSGMTNYVRPRSSLRTPIRSPAFNIKSCTSNLQCWIPDNLAPGGDFRNDGEGAGFRLTASAVSGMTNYVRPRSSLRTPIRSPAFVRHSNHNSDSYKSSHSGFCSSIKLIFQSLFQFLIDFSRLMAAVMSVCCSYHINR